MNQNNNFKQVDKAKEEILIRIYDIKKSIDNMDCYIELMAKKWDGEESHMFFFAYDEFRNEIDNLLLECDCGVNIVEENKSKDNNNLNDNIIS